MLFGVSRCYLLDYFFFFKQNTAYEWRISDWSSDVCSSDLSGQMWRIAFSQRQPDLGKALAKRRYDFGQYIARLSVCTSNGQTAFIASGELVADLLQVVYFTHDAVYDLRHQMPGFGQAFDAFPLTFKNLDTQLIFKLFDDFRLPMPGFGPGFDAFPVTLKNHYNQLIFKLDDGLGYAWLRRIQGTSCLGQVEITAYGFPNETKLLQVHKK